MKLSTILPYIFHRLEMSGTILSLSYFDLVFKEIAILGIKEIILSKEQMLMACQFYLATVEDKNSDKGKVLREGVLDKIFGVELKQEE